jgi:hypothetical protein
MQACGDLCAVLPLPSILGIVAHFQHDQSDLHAESDPGGYLLPHLRKQYARRHDPVASLQHRVRIAGVSDGLHVSTGRDCRGESYGLPDNAGLSDEMRVTLDAALLTVITSAEEVLAVSSESPLWAAVRLWLPTARVEMESAAVPPETEAVPRTMPLSRNCTLPLANDGMIAAVSTTVWPNTDAVVLLESIMLLVAFTVWLTLPKAALLLPSPLYEAVTV